MKTHTVTLIAALLVLASCASGPKPRLSKTEARNVNWSERIGSYTYDQAILDLGPPAIIGETSDGKTAEWILHRSPHVSFGFGVGGGGYGSHSAVGVGVGSSVSPPPGGENLRLKFDQDGKLKEWNKVV